MSPHAYRTAADDCRAKARLKLSDGDDYLAAAAHLQAAEAFEREARRLSELGQD